MSTENSFAFLKPGTKLGKYEIKGLLGRGAMAEVYRAHNPALNNDVAIKVMSPSIMDNSDAAARFRREAQAAARLSHPNIMRVYDFEIEGDIYYMVMELLEGRTLREIIREFPEGMPEDQALSLFRQLGEAVDSAHSQGVIHRDIKPTNVIVVRNRAVLTDFGLARISDQAQLTATGSSAGTPAYMSPEQASGSDITTRSDIYSLGILLYELVTGDVPFKGDTYASVLLQQIQAQPQMPTEIRDDLNPVLGAVIMRALSKLPDERYASAQDMIADINNDLDSLPEATQIFRTPRIVEVANLNDATMPLKTIPTSVLTGGSTILTPEEQQRQRAILGSVTVVAILLGLVVLIFALNLVSTGDDESSAPPEPPEGMIYVPGGSFEMGSTFDIEAPPHNVTITEFFIDRTEVTNNQYLEFVTETGADIPTTWAPPAESIWQIESEGVYVVGDFRNRWVYDGEEISFFPEGNFTIDLNADEDTGTVIVEFTGTITPTSGLSFEDARVRIVHEVFEQTASFHEGGVGDHVLMHGITGQEADFLPGINSPVSTWGSADILINTDFANDPENFTTFFSGVGAHMMFMPGVRDENGRILKADGTCCFDQSNPADSFVDEDDLEVMVLLFQGSGSGYSSGPPGVAGPEIWLNLYSEEVTVVQQPERNMVLFPEAQGEFPVTGVTWQQAQAYCEWEEKRLPTEAQWELAAGGLNELQYPWGEERLVNGEVPANVSTGVMSPVGSFPEGASQYGALDMAGNAWEWVNDFFDENYYAESVDAVDPSGPAGGELRIVRGGGPAQLSITGSSEFRTTARLPVDAEGTSDVFGFRCAAPVLENGSADS